jgi:glycosyltransferase involved in cell wall biosynthesis
VISVVIPLFNKEATIARALRSVLAQTFQDFEVIVVNDGSTDNGPRLVAGDPRIRLVNQANAGVAAARNRGVAETRGEIVAFLDADDEWLPGFLETVCSLMRAHPDSEMFATSYFKVGPDGQRRPARLSDANLLDYFRVASASEPPVNASCVAIRKRALEEVGGFPVGITSGEDLLTWARLAARAPVAYRAEPLAVFYRDGDEAMTGIPTRFPDRDDPVGRGLRELPQRPSLREYRALWHKMRARVFLVWGERGQALGEVWQSLGCKPWQPRLYLYLALALLPLRWVRRLFAGASR